MYCIEFDKERKYINDFIKLPCRLYSKKENMEDKSTMKKLLLGKHPLSKYFKLNKYLIYENSKCVARFILTTYPNDKTCYIGFFECIDNHKVAKKVFECAKRYAHDYGYTKLVGPVDASFWLTYRLKINKFDKLPYTGEPYNKPYYFNMFKKNGFRVIEHYTSNIYDTVSDNYSNDKFEERFKKFTDMGYKIISPDIKDYDEVVTGVYKLIMDLYSDFPIFKKLELEDFKEIFNSYKSILNMDMVKMGYYKDELVGFFISVPNYNNRVYHLNIKNILSILKLKKKPREYVMLYMGTDHNHRGLGKALASSITEELRKSKLPSIGALARDGKVTQKYAEDLIDSQYEYVLLGCDIK